MILQRKLDGMGEVNKTYRIRYIDIIKGIGILLIVLGHAYTNYPHIITAVYSFHIPLFFIISGVLFERNKAWNRRWFIHKVRTILIPYVVWGAIFQMFLLVLNLFGGNAIKGQFHDRVCIYIELASGAMWFLPVMFSANLVFAFMCWKKSKIICIFVGISFFIVAVFLPKSYPLVETFIRAGVGYLFLCIGYFWKKYFTVESHRWMVCAFLVLDVLMVYFNGTVSLAIRSFNNPITYIATSVLGSWVLFQICHWIDRNKKLRTGLLEKWGRYSIVILCTHQCIIEVIRILDYKFLGRMITNSGGLEGIIITIIIMVLITIFMPLLLKVFGWSWGIINDNPTIPNSIR